MALTSRSLFLYGYTISASNSNLDFVAVSGGSTLTASIDLGYYSLTDLLPTVADAMNAADPNNAYTLIADRTANNGLENRVSILTGGSYLSLLFGSGPSTATSIASTLGFTNTDQTGALMYTGTLTTGTALEPTLIGYNYLPIEMMQQNFGAVNISSAGLKEAITYSTQYFYQAQFMYEPQSKVVSEWEPLMEWMIQQRAFDFTPEVNAPTAVYNSTLESSIADPKGLQYKFVEMLPSFPFLYDTGLLKFRLKV